MGSYDAVPVPVMGTTGALRFLRNRFPELHYLFTDPDKSNSENLDIEPYFSYGQFAEEVLRRQDDKAFLSSVYEFIDDLALSGQSILQELFVLKFWKGSQAMLNFAASLYSNIHREAQDALRDVERQMYGRSRD
jgi:hypothetical protein